MGYNEWSDEESSSRNHGRDKFRHERSVERDRAYGNDEYERYDRKKRGRRSPTPPEDQRRHKRRPSFSPPPMRNYQPRGNRNERDMRNDPDTDHYIPNYDRDGYVPGPRYGNKPEILSNSPFVGSNNPGPGGFPMMDMMNPQMMNQGWTGNPGRFSVDPNQLDYLVPFKQFYDYTRRTSNRRIDDEDMQKKYAQYKEKFAARQLAQFFVANKEKEWFQEKYHPKLSQPRYDDIKLRRKRYLNTFLQDLEKGVFDNIRFDKEGQATTSSDIKNEDDTEPENTNTDGDNAEYESRLVIKTVPPTIAREKIIEMCNKIEGFDYLSLSEPGPNKKFHRIGWISFKEGTDMKKAFEQMDNQKVDDFVFHLAMNRKDTPQTRAPRIAPDISNTTERLQKDLDQAKELASALEAILGDDIQGLKFVEARAQKVIDERIKPEEEENKKEGSEDGKVDDEDSVDRWNLKKSLDLIIIYLRRVHMYCYYCALECDSLEELHKKCAEPHCRATASAVIDDDADPKLVAKNERGVAQWAKNLDQKISMKIHTPDDRELKRLGGRVLQSEIDDYVKEHVLKEHDSKYKCQVGECSKAFKGFDYVEKHILSKHPEEIDRIKAEVEYFNNYVCDPNHLIPSTNTPHMMNNMPGNMPFGQQPQPFMMARPPMHMPGMHSAVAGTPWDQIPRIGFGVDNPGWNSAVNAARRSRGPGAMDLDDSLPKDPRQVKSYVDLDAPAEGDSNISFY